MNESPEINQDNRYSSMEDMVEIDLKQLINVLINKWYLIIGITMLAVIAAALISYNMDPTYESSTEIIIDQQTGTMGQESLFSLSMAQTGDTMGNRLQILQSPLVIEKAVELLEEKGELEAAENIEENPGNVISVNNKGDTDIIEIAVTGGTPVIAREGARAVAEAYRDYRQSRAQEQSRRVLSFLEDQVQSTEKKAEKAERAVRDYQKQEGVISLDNEASKINDQLTELESKKLNTIINLESNNLRLEEVNKKLERLREQLPEESVVVTESLVQNLREQLSTLEAERVDYINRGLEDDSPEVASLDRRIENLEKSIREFTRQMTSNPEQSEDGLIRYNNLLSEKTNLEAEISGLTDSRRIISNKIEEYDKRLRQLSEKGFELARLKRDVEVAQSTYGMLSEELEKSKIAVEREIGDVRIIKKSQLPKAPISPKILLNIIIAGFLGVFTSVGLIFLLEFLDDRVKEKEELEKLTGVPVLGVIPDIEKVDHQRDSYYGDRG